MEKRLAAFKFASDLVAPIVEQHGVEKYSIGSFLTNTSTYTSVEQHITHILQVGDWLLEGDK